MTFIRLKMMDRYYLVKEQFMLFPTVKRSPAIDTVADSIFYVATDGGAYISDYISTYSYGSPDIGGASYTYFIMPAGNFNYDFASVYSYGHKLSGHE